MVSSEDRLATANQSVEAVSSGSSTFNDLNRTETNADE